MIVISDTTPIISLLKAGHLELLQQLYQKVLIPQAVWHELTKNPAYANEAEIINTMTFLSPTSVKNVQSIKVLRSITGLDSGESEALILYDERNADLLLMDERKGRNVAKQLHVQHIGTAGVLMLAYDKNLISAIDVKQCIDTMLINNIHMDKKICNVVMEHIGLSAQY